ncbi:hypothetical protein GLE_3477 [Lysobacter enzymogenes]|uniref:Uncharacterized protein n=1 Tax=Lysobacter enzymogenes TaxID=69 RepID=A0A0S2DJQ2_LYSEN|nr:hypothetical protein GLE_3477 [Lysobacter enzymogenes]
MRAREFFARRAPLRGTRESGRTRPGRPRARAQPTEAAAMRDRRRRSASRAMAAAVAAQADARVRCEMRSPAIVANAGFSAFTRPRPHRAARRLGFGGRAFRPDAFVSGRRNLKQKHRA